MKKTFSFVLGALFALLAHAQQKTTIVVTNPVKTVRVEMVEVKISDFPGVRPAAEGVDKDMRHACNAAQMYVVARLHGLYCLVGTHVMKFFHCS